MDIFSFLNSRDIREHLKKINYQFSPFEAAWIINDSMDATLEEKHAAWRELIDTSPDCELPFDESHRCNGSLHRMLERRIDFDRRMTEEFYDRDGCVYCARVYDSIDEHGMWDNGLYESAERAIASAKQWSEHPAWVMAEKRHLNRESMDMDAFFNASGELMQLDFAGYELPEADRAIHLCFEDYWLDFSTPFQKGDILCFRRNPLRGVYDDFRDPFVVERINRDGFFEEYETDEPLANRIGADMTVHGFFQASGGSVYELTHYNYMDCEFFRGTMGEEKRALVAVQKYLRGEIPLDLLLNSYHHVLDESQIKFWDSAGYPDEMKAYMKTYDHEPIHIWVRNVPENPDFYWDIGKIPEGCFPCRSVNQAKNKILDCERKGIPIQQIDCFQDLGNFTSDGGDGSALLAWMNERRVFYSFRLHPGK